MVQVTIEEAKLQLQELIEKGEPVMITQGGAQVAQLVPATISKQARQPGSAKGMITISDDFDEHLGEFKAYS